MNRRSFLKLFSVATVAIATSTLRAADLVMPTESATGDARLSVVPVAADDGTLFARVPG